MLLGITIIVSVLAITTFALYFHKSIELENLKESVSALKSIIESQVYRLRNYENAELSKAKVVEEGIATDIRSAVTTIEADVKKVL